jgi:hypothetical protein
LAEGKTGVSVMVKLRIGRVQPLPPEKIAV